MNRSVGGNTNGGLSGGETAGLVVGIIGVLLAALTVYRGWKLRSVSNDHPHNYPNDTLTVGPFKDQTNPAVTNVYYYPPASSHPPAPPGQEIALQQIASQPRMPALQPPSRSPTSVLVDNRPPHTHTGRASTWPDVTTPAS